MLCFAKRAEAPALSFGVTVALRFRGTHCDRSTCHRAWMDSICSKGIRVVNIDPCAVSEFTLEKLLVKNKVEQWRVVVDLEDCSITSTPIGILKQVCDTLTVSITNVVIHDIPGVQQYRRRNQFTCCNCRL